jgi:hypothetical protein
MRRIEAKWKANYWCEEQFWCKVLELRVHWAIALCSEINWPKEQAAVQFRRELHSTAPNRDAIRRTTFVLSEILGFC